MQIPPIHIPGEETEPNRKNPEAQLQLKKQQQSPKIREAGEKENGAGGRTGVSPGETRRYRFDSYEPSKELLLQRENARYLEESGKEAVRGDASAEAGEEGGRPPSPAHLRDGKEASGQGDGNQINTVIAETEKFCFCKEGKHDPDTGTDCYIMITSMKTPDGTPVNSPEVGKKLPYKD